MKPLVECIPNFSEGRRPEIVEQIVDSIRAVSGVYVLDYSLDHDHNRSVVTFAGSPEGVEEAAFRAIQTAAQLIDLTQHEGEHPRIGATDVVPFVPIRDVTMDDCVQMAQRVGQRVGSQLDIPVYLYEEAATRPDRVNLANLRQGEYEGLKEEVKTNTDRTPDFGPAELGSAGATVIGARVPLIAYNVYLNTDDIDAANKIARAIRHSGGGLRFVKALGLPVEGMAQVSMNLTDYTRTPIHRVQELIKVEAARYGYQSRFAELIGLIPEQALIDSARWYLQLDRFDENQILERQIQAAESADTIPNAFLSAVADGTPAPGGGSVAALAGALAAALGAMVARLTVGKKKYADVENQMTESLTGLEEHRAELTRIIEADSEAFNQVMDAYRLDKNTPDRADTIQDALAHAAYIPYETARLAMHVMTTLVYIAENGNVNAATDAAVGAQMALAAIEGASMNVLVNLADMDADFLLPEIRLTVAQTGQEINDLRQSARQVAAEIRTIVENRLGLA